MLAALIPIFGTLIDKIFPDAQKASEAKLKLFELQQNGELARMAEENKLALGQMEINKVEAADPNLFKSGWRPAIGWICGLGLLYQLFLRPLLGWVAMSYLGWQAPPSLDMETLMTLLFGILGLGGLRTFEKTKGVS